MKRYYMAVFPDGQVQQIQQELDQEDMTALNDGDISEIIRYDEDIGFQRAIIAPSGEGQFTIQAWGMVELIVPPK